MNVAGNLGSDCDLIELPTHKQGNMLVSSEDGVETVFLLVGEQTDAGADRFADHCTGHNQTCLKRGLRPLPHLIELRTDQRDIMEGIHDHGGFRHHFGVAPCSRPRHP